MMVDEEKKNYKEKKIQLEFEFGVKNLSRYVVENIKQEFKIEKKNQCKKMYLKKNTFPSSC